MAIRDVLIHPDPRLKKVCDPIPELTPEIEKLAEDLLETMYDAPGIGLAAPQVGVTRRLLVMDCEKAEDAPPKPMVLINPAVTWASEAMNTYEEGCLSIPGQFYDVTRPEKVRVRWL
ncbi:MAG TPA: peptide deformylase, partial [Rhodobacteraceae bacterium]|nr:peptide deformylase [Paracoccaceae bacterium]